MDPQLDANVRVFADYHQFYLWDAGVSPQAPEDWSDEDVANRAKVAEHVLVICPVRDMTVPVRLTLHLAEPAPDLSRVDHAVRASLTLPTGQLQLHESTGAKVLTWQVQPGTYEALALFTGLGTLSADGLDGQDMYHVALWPGRPSPLHVVKRWSERAA